MPVTQHPIGAGEGLARAFDIDLDDAARGWLTSHPIPDGLVIAYEDHRCCGGGRICDVQVRGQKPVERATLARIGDLGGRPVLADRRIVARLPRRLPVTVRGVGPFRGLALGLSGEEWAELLYA